MKTSTQTTPIIHVDIAQTLQNLQNQVKSTEHEHKVFIDEAASQLRKQKLKLEFLKKQNSLLTKGLVF